MPVVRRTILVGVAAVTAGMTLAACYRPVHPSVAPARTTFEGFEVISHIPENPRGLIYLFHGTGGSADFATRVDTVDALNQFVADGYGYVATSSTERTGNRRWLQSDPSLTTNPDLARLTRLQAHLVATTPVTAGTPLFGIGMSNGARFVTLWGQTWRDAGSPVRAVWASHGRIAAPVAAAGGLTVPTVFSTSVNDFTVPPAWVRQDFQVTRQRGTPARLFESIERPLDGARFLRIPGIDADEANAVERALVDTGVWNADGARVVPDVQAAAQQATTATLPPSVTAAGLGGAVVNEVARILAVHQFTPEFTADVLAFFDGHLAA
jgi:hypothetical protein